jgi:molecular chaperone GrpE
MPKRKEPREPAASSENTLTGSQAPTTDEGSAEFKVEDRRHWVDEEGETESESEVAEEITPARPTVLDEYRNRAEEAEQRLLEYIEAFKQFKGEQEQVRGRLNRDIDRKVALKFGGLVAELLETLDDLDRALSHADSIPEATSIAEGLLLARKGFLSALERHGVEQVSPDDDPFDPNIAEAVRVDPVDAAERNGVVTETLRPGYRLDDHVIRPARVAVGRHTETGS